jgi:hypothetical protein
MSHTTHGYLMIAAGISPTYLDQPCAITRTGRHRRMQPDINLRRQFYVFSHFNTFVPSLRDRIFAFPQLLAGLQCP